jgi:signal transduction histidine kinase
MVGLHVDITERKRREEENAALIEVARALGGTLDLGELLARVQRCVAQVLPCDFVVTFAWDPARSVFRNVSHYGVAPELVAEVERAEYPMDDAIRKQLRRETLVVNDITKQDLLPVESFAAFHISALMATPLAVHGRPFDNALVAYATTPGARFDERQVELFEAIGRQLGVAMEAAELYRVQKEEAEVSAGLAKVGQDLISSLDRPDMLDRLCRLTTELLGCDTSHTMLWQPRDDVYAGVAGYGYQPEEWNVLRAMKLPRARLLGLLKQLANASATQGLIRTPSDPLWRSLGQQLGVASTLITALRHGADVIGLQVACYRRGEQSFSLQQERLARGIATLASLALQHARLVDELERANRIKSEFLANMSHELRTPLNVLIGYNDLLLSEEFGPLVEPQRETLRHMDRSARQLHELINAILDLSRLEADQAPLELSDLSVSDLIRELEEEMLQRRAQANLQFTWRVLPEVPRLRTDAIKLKVILKNLIANAVKFTRQGSITVVARVRDAGVEFSVTDTGIGIAPYVLPTIFEPFRQGDSSTTRSYGGIGLGLYVVRRLLELLGGSVTAESDVGRGSTFRVWVPTAGIATVENAAAG